MLDDFANGRLKKLYRAPHLQDLGNLPMPRYDLLDLSRYGLIKTYSVQASGDALSSASSAPSAFTSAIAIATGPFRT